MRSSERWETGKGRWTGRGEAGNFTDRSAYGARSLELREASKAFMVPEERERDKMFTSKGRLSEGGKRAVQL